MAIPKLSSKDLNGILNKAQDKMTNMQEDVERIKEDTLQKMNILKNEHEFSLSQFELVAYLVSNMSDDNQARGLKNKAVFISEENLSGVYDKFGNTVHPRFIREPMNVFNLMTTNGPMFRDNVNVSINGVKRESFKHMLMHAASDEKGIFFEEYDSPNLKIEIEIDTSNLLGDTDFNVIEINPYLPGSFGIDYLKITEGSGDPIIQNSSYLDRIGPSRYLLDRKRTLTKIEMEIELEFKNSNGKYPFGLKHLYFLNADFDPESHLIAKIEKNHFIETIGEEIFVHDGFSFRRTTAKDEGIKLYLSETNGVLEYELETSSHEVQNTISRNTRSFFARIPLQNNTMTSIEFSDIKTR